MLSKIRTDLLSEVAVFCFKTSEKSRQIVCSFNGKTKPGLNKATGFGKLPVPGPETHRQSMDCRLQQIVYAF